MKSNQKTISRLERGQSMVELALSFTVLLILLSGVVDLGRAFFTFMALRDAAQEGALYGSLFPADPNDTTGGTLNTIGIVNRVRMASSSPVNLTNPNITVDILTVPAGGPLCQGTGIRVNVSYTNFPLIMPFWNTLMGTSTIPIHATIEDTIITPPCH